VLQILLAPDFPDNYRLWAAVLLAIFAAGAFGLLAIGREHPGSRLALTGLAFDFAVATGFTVLFAFDPGTPVRQLLVIVALEGAARFGLRGGIAVAIASAPVAAGFELRRDDFFHVGFRADYVTFQVGATLLAGLLVGWLVTALDGERGTALQRAAEAEALRDELGRRADLLEAAGRCARALGSSLDLDEAFGDFIRELRGLVPFRRMAIVLAEGGVARVIATAGEQADVVMPPGSELRLERNVLTEVVEHGQAIYREEMEPERFDEEATLLTLGIRSRVIAPLLVGSQPIGVITLGRGEPHAFDRHDIELLSLLGRFIASSVQNIRAFEGERRTVEELRRLSALRADFVSLVSHELRSPMAAVIGAARTLEQRWRELRPDQRQSFIALIADETDRLAALVGDVLDTSRIDEGTFGYSFAEVDLASVVRDSVAAAGIAQDEVQVVAELPPQLPAVHGDAERLRQVLANLIDNAVKYSPVGVPVVVRADVRVGHVDVTVSDMGPGIAVADRELVFEKFGRVTGPGQKQGTGLGLYIARSIAEAHGGTVTLEAPPGGGARFVLRLPTASATAPSLRMSAANSAGVSAWSASHHASGGFG